jgi:hypothetical protein
MSALGEPRPRKGVSGAIGRHGPNWIIAVGTLLAAVAAAGFIGHATAAPTTAAPQPTVTVTATVTAPGSGAGGPSASTSTPPIGTLVGQYSFHLPGPHGAPLGATAPTQQQIVASAPADVVYRADLGGAPVVVGPGDQMFQLTNGTTPTYDACTKSTNVTNGVPNVVPGTVFCVVESTGLVAGVKVTSTHQVNDGAPWSLELTVWVWQAV